MPTLKELCEQNKLPFKVMRGDWQNHRYFLIMNFNERNVIGFNEIGRGDWYGFTDLSDWNLYTESEPKKVEDQDMLEELLATERERILAEVLPVLENLIKETNGFDVSTNYFRDQKLTTANKLAKELLEKLRNGV
jgi:hypothetical protein